MPKFYKVINLKRQQSGPYILPEAGYKITMGTKSLADNIKVLGECDAAGNMLHDIASNNFVSKSTPVKTGPGKTADSDPDFEGDLDPMFSGERPIDPELLYESAGPDLQSFDDKTPTINEQKTSEQQSGPAITDGPKPGANTTGRKSGAKSGSRKSGAKK